MILKAGLAMLWLACFGSFATARGRQFTGKATNRMRLTAAAGAIVSMIQLAALLCLPVRWTSLPAAVLYALALALFRWSARVNREHPLGLAFAPDPPQHLVVAGPYRFVRHPYYVSYLTFWTAGAVASEAVWGLALVGLMAILYRRAADHEEALYATSELADAYAAYRQHSGRFLPRLGSFAPRAQHLTRDKADLPKR